MISNHVIARWLARVAQPSSVRHQRRRSLHSAAAPAEMLETRVLLSATGKAAAASSVIHHSHSDNGNAHQGLQLAFQTQPANTMAGQAFSVSVVVEDVSGNPIASNSSVVQLRVRGQGNCSSDQRFTVTAVNGVATFNNVLLTKAGTYTLQANVEHCGQVRSNSFVVSPDTIDPEHLAFLRHNPHEGAVGQSLKTILVAVEDQFGNIVTSDNSSVTLGINSGPTQSFDASVPSPDTVAVQNGVAQFNGVILDVAGVFTFSASDSNSSTSAGVSAPVIIHALDHQGHDQQGQNDQGHGLDG
jgi:hypothetical protein